VPAKLKKLADQVTVIAGARRGLVWQRPRLPLRKAPSSSWPPQQGHADESGQADKCQGVGAFRPDRCVR
jgi:hypothetical protein